MLSPGSWVSKPTAWRSGTERLQGIETALKAEDGDPLTAELDAAMRRLGEITMENELLRYKK